MGVNPYSELKNPERGQVVWVILSGEPHMRYFVEPYSQGCRWAFDPELTNVVYDDVALLFPSEASIHHFLIGGCVSRIAEANREIARRCRRLKQLGCAPTTTECPFCMDETLDTGGDKVTCERCGCLFRFDVDGPTILKEPVPASDTPA